jgi:hypothetical protein
MHLDQKASREGNTCKAWAKWQKNVIKIDLREIDSEVVEWTHWQAPFNIVVNLLVP